MVDLCSDDDDVQPAQPSSKRPRSSTQQQQQRQAGEVSDSEWESAEGSDGAAQQHEPGQQPAVQQQQRSRQQGRQQQGGKPPGKEEEEALELLLPCLTENPSSMSHLWSCECSLVLMLQYSVITPDPRPSLSCVCAACMRAFSSKIMLGQAVVLVPTAACMKACTMPRKGLGSMRCFTCRTQSTFVP
jgi:hypothetical protein